MLWIERNETLWDLLFQEKNRLRCDNVNPASSRLSVADYFPITARSQVQH